jgi:hypothetical protein
LTALNGLTAQVQFFAVGTSGNNFNISSSTDTHTFNLPTASGTNRGALSSTDWTTFNNKENAITAGTTAQYFRGDKTFQTLNTSVVPELTNLYYTEARVNANTNVAANTAARHNAVTLGTANGLSLSTQVLSLGLASAGVTGALSGTDWSTFNSKQNALTNPVTGTGTSGQVAYFTGTTTISSESNLFWDATNDRLGIGVPNPLVKLDIDGSAYIRTGGILFVDSLRGYSTSVLSTTLTGLSLSSNFGITGGNVGIGTNTPTNARLVISSSANDKISIDGGSSQNGMRWEAVAGANGFYLYNGTISSSGWGLYNISTTASPFWVTNGGNFIIGSTSDAGFKLDVLGTGRFTGNLTVGNASGSVNIAINRGAASDGNGLRFQTAGTNNWYLGSNTTAPSTDFEIYNHNTASSNLILNYSTGSATFSSSVTATQFIASGGNNTTVFNSTSATTGWVQMAMNNTSGSALLGVENSSGGTLATGTSAYATVLRNYTNTDLQIATNNIVRTTITSGGNVGIGTATPTTFSGNTVLAINNTAGGAVVELQSNGTSALRMATSSSDSALWEPRNVPVLFATNNLERFTIHQNGNIVFKGQSTATSGESLFQNNDSALSFYSTQSSVLASKEIRFFTKVSNAEQRMTILANGNVLIGTTSNNGSRFQVNGASSFAGTAIINSGTRNVLYLVGTVDDNNYSDAIYLSEGSGQATGRQSISWFNDNQNYWKARMWTQVGAGYGATLFGIDVADDARNIATRLAIRNGNVMIGTQTNSGDRLRVAGTTFSDEIMTLLPEAESRSNINWRFGSASIGSLTTNRRLRVKVAGVEYWIAAVEI